MLTKSQIQHVKSLRTKKFRQKYNQFVVEGEKAVLELLESTYVIDEVFGLDEWRLENLPKLKQYKFNTVTKKELERISGFEQPNKVLAVVQKPEHSIEEDIWKAPIVIALDFLQDPGNLGTIIRTADWYGVKHILCSTNCVDVYSPKVINATMGSFMHVKVYYTNLEEVLVPHKENIYACVMEGESVYKTNSSKNKIILIGNEGKGISTKLLGIAKNKISIPRKGEAESLNAAVATAVIVDVLGQRHL